MSSFKKAELASVENYVVKPIEAPATASANTFVNQQADNKAARFELNARVSDFIGLTDAKNKEDKRKFDAEVLKYVQKIKDNAYQEAFEKGLQEGIQKAKEEAFQKAEESLNVQINHFSNIVKSLDNSRQKMYEINETEIINFCYLLAEKIILKQVEKDPSLFVSTIQSVLQSHEVHHIFLSETDHNFLQQHSEIFKNDIDLKKIKIEINPSLKSGDVIFSNDSGTIDGTLKTRLKTIQQILDHQES